MAMSSSKSSDERSDVIYEPYHTFEEINIKQPVGKALNKSSPFQSLHIKKRS